MVKGLLRRLTFGGKACSAGRVIVGTFNVKRELWRIHVSMWVDNVVYLRGLGGSSFRALLPISVKIAVFSTGLAE